MCVNTTNKMRKHSQIIEYEQELLTTFHLFIYLDLMTFPLFTWLIIVLPIITTAIFSYNIPLKNDLFL